DPLDDVWAGDGEVYVVGVHVAKESVDLFVLIHWDGSRWIRETPDVTGCHGQIHHVWGSAPNDVWFACDDYQNAFLHWNGSGWATVAPSSTSTARHGHPRRAAPWTIFARCGPPARETPGRWAPASCFTSTARAGRPSLSPRADPQRNQRQMLRCGARPATTYG